MLLELIFEQQVEWNKERTQMLSEHDSTQATKRPDDPVKQSNIVKIV
jgi:hypothetical protein